MSSYQYQNKSICEEHQGIYFGDRGEEFKRLIVSLLNKGKLKKRYIRILTTPESMEEFSSAFTSELVDEDNNYQVYEQLGDLTGNKFIVWYMYRRFPQLKCAKGVKVVARLRINYGAKQSFSDIAKGLGFWPFITATNELRQRKMKPLLEDVFEAVLGVIETILDREIKHGIGYALVYRILESIFDKKDISLRYDDLYDAKTRLKELFDVYESALGPLVYKEGKTETLTISSVYRVDGGKYEERANGTINKKRIIGGRYVLMGTGKAALKADSQQNAASIALRNLKQSGYVKLPPKIYRQFDSNEDKTIERITPQKILEKWGEDVNVLVSTKPKSKYQSKYQSTPISMYCRERNVDGIRACLELKADCNMKDTDGMLPLDLVFIGKKDPEKVKEIIQLLQSDPKMDYRMNPEIYNKYTREYYDIEGFFTSLNIQIV